MNFRFLSVFLFLNAMLFGAATVWAAELEAEEFDRGGDLHITAEIPRPGPNAVGTARSIDASSERTGPFTVPFTLDGEDVYLTEDAADLLRELEDIGDGLTVFSVEEDEPSDRNAEPADIPMNATIEFVGLNFQVTGDEPERVRFVFNVQGGQVALHLPDEAFPALAEATLEREEEVIIRSFNGVLRPPNVIAGQWRAVSDAPRSIRGISSFDGSLTFHRRESHEITADVTYAFFADGTYVLSGLFTSKFITDEVILGPVPSPLEPFTIEISDRGTWTMR